MAVNAGPNIVEDGLVLYLDAGNSKSYPGTGTTWTDLSGQSNNGILVNGPTYSVQNGGAITLDGVNDHFFIPHSNTLPKIDMFSISFMYFFVNTTSGKRMLHKGVLTNNNIEYYVNLNPTSAINTVTFGCSSQGNSATFKNTTFQLSSNFLANSWYNIVFTKNAATVKGYLNGILLGTDTQTPTPVFNGSNPIYLGTRPQIDVMDNGIWSSFMMYSNKVLSDNEVAQNFAATRGRFGL